MCIVVTENLRGHFVDDGLTCGPATPLSPGLPGLPLLPCVNQTESKLNPLVVHIDPPGIQTRINIEDILDLRR